MADGSWRPRPQPLGRYWAGKLLVVPTAALALAGLAAHQFDAIDEVVSFNWDVFLLAVYGVGLFATPFVFVWAAVKR